MINIQKECNMIFVAIKLVQLYSNATSCRSHPNWLFTNLDFIKQILLAWSQETIFLFLCLYKTILGLFANLKTILVYRIQNVNFLKESMDK